MYRHCKHEMSEDVPTVSRNGWAVVYAGFIIMLLCFFIMLCAYSVTDRSKVSLAVKSFSSAVSLPTTARHPSLPESGENASLKSSNLTGTDSDLDGLYHSIQKMAATLGMEQDISASVYGKGVLLQLSSSILFDAGQAEVLPEGKKLIAHVGDILVSHPMYDLRIEGHTDNTPIHTVRYPSNWELSTSRAVNVLRCFIEQHLVNASRLSAVGFGEYSPHFPNNTPENKSKNRRVELFFSKNNVKKVVQ